ncbi:hypothetical protein [Fibrobacter sp.]|uniref:hypothetical protein n=1 Tax=Fibrobacter sp. TaxID=35828 RepID=UPI0025C32B9C|nr:hypothetical protein [Fibrobacter sp.]MBR3071716.1 hypothetical protein [Fibrobacter sp.]
MSLNARKSFVQSGMPTQEGMPLIAEAIKQEEEEQKELLNLREKRFARKRKLLLETLGMLVRHKDEIFATPRYANIDVHYIFEDSVKVRTSCEFNFCGAPVSINLRLATLLKIWNCEQFTVECDCGATAVVYKFVDSPSSGSCVASALCPCCKKEIHDIKCRPSSDYVHVVNNFFIEDMTAVAKNFLAKWRLAKKVFQEKVENGKNGRKLQTADRVYGDYDLCSLETMIQELQLKEFEEASIRT